RSDRSGFLSRRGCAPIPDDPLSARDSTLATCVGATFRLPNPGGKTLFGRSELRRSMELWAGRIRCATGAMDRGASLQTGAGFPLAVSQRPTTAARGKLSQPGQLQGQEKVGLAS